MFLKSLTLKGFKSFADPATLQMEPGVTVVVGPNGSGKSNVVDAVAWVLGAQGPRTVRSSKMEDVIFAGSADRPALGRAEVSLTIDNRSGRLPGGLAEITITRTLFRSGDSEYALNGQPCRLLDIQELLSDSGVGRQQHVIMSQGQLDAILNARPEDRRMVVEEAAGVLKHRRRRERSERRLAATEENLERLGDLVREVRRQIRPLERQATAARSHASLSEEVRVLRLHLVGRELATLGERRHTATLERDRLAADEAVLQKSLGELDSAMELAAAELSARREEDLVVALTRVQGLVERCRGLGGVLVERRRSLAQALDAAAAADVVSSLESDAARLATSLDEVAAEADALAPAWGELERAEADLAGAVVAYEEAYADVAGLRDVEEAFAVARSELEALSGTAERERLLVDRLERRLSALEESRQARASELQGVAAQLADIESQAPGLEAAVQSTTSAARQAALVAAEAEEAARNAERDRHRTEARAEALARALEQARGGGAEVLGGIAGMVGTLEDLVVVDDGWHAAFEAAIGAALASAVVVDGADSARAALARLHEHQASGTVLAVGSGGDAGAVAAVPARPTHGGLEPLSAHVRPAVAAVGPLLDALVGTSVVVGGGWREAVDLALARPDLVVVTRHGDRFSSRGWIVRGDDAPATAAAADEARAQAEVAAEHAATAGVALAAARDATQAAQHAAAEAVRARDRVVDARPVVAAAEARLVAALAAVTDELADAGRHRDEAAERVALAAARRTAVEARLPSLEAASAAGAERLEEAAAARRGLEERRGIVSSMRRDVEVRAAGLAERRSVLTDRLEDVERRLAGHVEERERATDRRRRI
ncbi:MAG TPA: AAA family ATPase, partial [Acidimicrobiales bacterium]|nr:AAA family ATPase [Acidimicrobiales bacterium]